MCIEKAAGIEISERAQYIRTIMDELQRIDSHLLFYSCLVMDMGGLTPFFYGFREREMILDIFEEIDRRTTDPELQHDRRCSG